MEKDINKLLNRYLQAQTTLEEEKELKQYFNSETISDRWLIYHKMFDAFAQEADTKMNPKKIRIPTKKSKKRIFSFILYPSIAVSVLIFFLVFSNENSKSYVRINGKKIKEPEFVEQYTSAKFKKAGLLLSGSLNSFDNLHKIKKGVEVGNETLEDVKETIQTIYENLPIKIIKHEKNDDFSRMLPADSSDNESADA